MRTFGNGILSKVKSPALVRFWRIYSRDKLGMLGLLILSGITLLSLLAPYLPLKDPFAIVYRRFLPPSFEHPLGTDHLGRDVFSRVIWGSRTSLVIGFIAAGISALIGTTLGSIAGYYGGLIDDILTRIIDIFLMIPAFFLILFIIAVYGSNIIYVMIVIGLLTWPSNARIMRAQVLSIREREFVQAAILMGVSNIKVLIKHIIPNAIHPVIANSILQAAGAIIIEAGISYLGLGDPNAVSWGRIIYEGQSYITSYWWISFFPGVAIAITVLSLYLVGETLSKIFNPKSMALGG